MKFRMNSQETLEKFSVQDLDEFPSKIKFILHSEFTFNFSEKKNHGVSGKMLAGNYG